MTAAVTPRTSTVTCPHCGKRNRVPAVADGVPKCGNCHQALQSMVVGDRVQFRFGSNRTSQSYVRYV